MINELIIRLSKSLSSSEINKIARDLDIVRSSPTAYKILI